MEPWNPRYMSLEKARQEVLKAAKSFAEESAKTVEEIRARRASRAKQSSSRGNTQQRRESDLPGNEEQDSNINGTGVHTRMSVHSNPAARKSDESNSEEINAFLTDSITKVRGNHAAKPTQLFEDEFGKSTLDHSEGAMFHSSTNFLAAIHKAAKERSSSSVSSSRNSVENNIKGSSSDSRSPNVQLRTDSNTTDETLCEFWQAVRKAALQKISDRHTQNLEESVLIELHLDMSTRDISDMRRFKFEVAIDVARAAAIDLSWIHISTVREGRVVVEFALVHEGSLQTTQNLLKIASALELQAQNPSSRLMRGMHTCKTIGVSWRPCKRNSIDNSLHRSTIQSTENEYIFVPLASNFGPLTASLLQSSLNPGILKSLPLKSSNEQRSLEDYARIAVPIQSVANGILRRESLNVMNGLQGEQKPPSHSAHINGRPSLRLFEPGESASQDPWQKDACESLCEALLGQSRRAPDFQDMFDAVDHGNKKAKSFFNSEWVGDRVAGTGFHRNPLQRDSAANAIHLLTPLKAGTQGTLQNVLRTEFGARGK